MSALRNALMDLAAQVKALAPESSAAKDGSFAIKVLSEITNGMSVKLALGRPGDWGYETPIGQALIHYIAADKADRLRAVNAELLAVLDQAIPLVAAHARSTAGEGALTLQVMRNAIAEATQS